MCLVTQSCLTLCDPVDCSPPGSFVHVISQSGNWTGFQFPSPGNLPDPRIKSAFPALAASFFTAVPPGKPLLMRWFGTKSKISLSLPLHGTSVQFSSVAQSCLTFCDPMDCGTPRFPVHHQLLELAQTHVH